MKASLFVVCIFGICRLTAQIAAPVALGLNLDNDYFYLPRKTDQYYTHGMKLWLRHPKLAHNPLNHLLRGDVYELHLQQQLFTPRDLALLETAGKDRPFASTLVLRSVARSDRAWGRLRTSLALGVLGAPSGGAWVQDLFHGMVEFAEPLPGWRNEVRTDVVVNYGVTVDYRLWASRRLNLGAVGRARVGTLYNDLRLGPALQLVGQAVNVTLATGLRIVGYDATMQGGLLRRDARYRDVVQLRRAQSFGRAGVSVGGRRLQVQAALEYRGREYLAGRSHVFGSLGLVWFGPSRSTAGGPWLPRTRPKRSARTSTATAG